MEKGHRGRPRKEEGSIEFWQFARAAIVTCAYDEARQNGEKHSSAVRHAVDSLKLCSQEMPVSETEVRRILSTFRPRGSGTILRFERSTLREEDIKINRWIREQFAALQEKKGITLLAPPVYDETRSIAILTVRLADRPSYPRHNRKAPNE
jgi:hypothetical protein